MISRRSFLQFLGAASAVAGVRIFSDKPVDPENVTVGLADELPEDLPEGKITLAPFKKHEFFCDRGMLIVDASGLNWNDAEEASFMFWTDYETPRVRIEDWNEPDAPPRYDPPIDELWHRVRNLTVRIPADGIGAIPMEAEFDIELEDGRTFTATTMVGT